MATVGVKGLNVGILQLRKLCLFIIDEIWCSLRLVQD